MERKSILKRIALVFFLLLIFIYISVFDNLPKNIVIFEGEKLGIKTILGVKATTNYEAIEAVSQDSKQLENAGKANLQVSLFDNIFVKNVDVDILPKMKVIPVGSMAGVKLYTNGVLVVGMSEIEGTDNKKYRPYESTGIVEGDRIIEINHNEIDSTKTLTKVLNESDGNNINVKYVHNEETKECSMLPVKTGNSEYKIGLWVRDSAAGVGTVTFYEPESKKFGALGHGITDIDTEELINIASGEFITTNILSVKKGEVGNPGKLQGTVNKQKNIGEIYKNSKFGVYGVVNNLSNLNIDKSKEMEVALRDEIQKGQATILCSIDNQAPKEYKIEIEKIYKDNNYDNKSMKIKVTDEELLEKTGGIIQGMSGAPIIQNGKFIGAITHVLVQNPEEGYAVFGDIMIKQMCILETEGK